MLFLIKGCNECEGLNLCYNASPNVSCCNYYIANTCVEICPSPFYNNTEYDCVCPVGTTGHNCSESKFDNSIHSLILIKLWIFLIAIDCGSLGDPENGMVSVSTTTYNSVATYSCNTGYTRTGNVSRTCLDTGLWSGNEPTCSGKPTIKALQGNFLKSHTHWASM